MTDGYVGNDNEIIAEIRNHSNARVFSFGIGSSVNRFLLDKMAEAGRGEVEYVSLNSDASAAAKRFHERVRNPLLTDIEIDWNGLPVRDVVPARIPDLFSAKPILVSGRYTGEASGKLRIRGKIGSRAYSREIDVHLPAQQKDNSSAASVWARHKIDALNVDENLNREAITQLGLNYKLMTRFTSFYAVEDRIVNEGGQSRRVEVVVDLPEGVSHEQSTHVAYASVVRTFMPAAPSAGDLNREQNIKSVRQLYKETHAQSSVKIRVKLMLKTVDASILQKLKDLGFVADPTAAGARFLTGSIDSNKLEDLRKLEQVLRVEEVQ